MAQYSTKLTKGDIDGLVKERGKAIDKDDFVEEFIAILKKIKSADAEQRRVDLIIGACRQFYLNGYWDGLTHYNEAIEPMVNESVPEEPDFEGEEEKHGLTLKDLGL